MIRVRHYLIYSSVIEAYMTDDAGWSSRLSPNVYVIDAIRMDKGLDHERMGWLCQFLSLPILNKLSTELVEAEGSLYFVPVLLDWFNDPQIYPLHDHPMVIKL